MFLTVVPSAVHGLGKKKIEIIFFLGKENTFEWEFDGSGGGGGGGVGGNGRVDFTCAVGVIDSKNGFGFLTFGCGDDRLPFFCCC